MPYRKASRRSSAKKRDGAPSKSPTRPTPLRTVKERFESKDKLVEAVKELMSDDLWLPRLNADRGGPKGIERVSNTKLLKLHATLGLVKKEFGSRAKLIDAIVALEGRGKDAGFRVRLEAYAAPRLYDLYRSKNRKRPAGGGGLAATPDGTGSADLAAAPDGTGSAGLAKDA